MFHQRRKKAFLNEVNNRFGFVPYITTYHTPQQHIVNITRKVGKMSTKNEQKEATGELNLHQRMLAITADCQKKKADSRVSAGKLNYDYTSHNAVTELIQPLLVKHGVDAMPCLRRVERERYTEIVYDKEVIKSRVTVFFDILFFNVDDPEDQEAVPWIADAMGNTDKVLGIAVSAGIRQCYQKRFKLRTGDPDLEESDNAKGNEKKKNVESQIENKPVRINEPENGNVKLCTKKQETFIVSQAKKFKWDDMDLHDLYSEYGVNGPSEFAFDDVNEVLAKIQTGPKADIPF